MSRFKITVLMLWAFVFLFPDFASAIKARPPLQLMFQEQRLSETEIEITLTAHANRETPSVSLSITLPPDLLLIAGETEWEGPMSAEKEHSITITILKPDALRSVIEGRAWLSLPDDAVFEQLNRLVLESSIEKEEKKNKAFSLGNRGKKQRSIFDFKGE